MARSSQSNTVSNYRLERQRLIYNRAEAARERIALRTDYPQVLKAFLQWCLQYTSSKVVLVPHVQAELGSAESDYGACRSLIDSLQIEEQERISILPPTLPASELKWFIGHCDWFCGTRMHSTIAALGSHVPCAALAYSMKTHGVFAQCGLKEEVLEMRHLDTCATLARLKKLFLTRQATCERHASHIPALRKMAEQQMDVITGNLSMEDQRAVTDHCTRVAPRVSTMRHPGMPTNLRRAISKFPNCVRLKQT